MRKIVLTFGFIAGGILAATMLVSTAFHDQIGFTTAGYVVGYASMVLAFLMIFFGIRAHRETSGGSVTFGQGLKVGLLIMFIGSCCYVATWEFVYYQFSPDFADKYAAYAIKQARESGASDAKIAAITKEMAQFKEEYNKPLVNIAYTFLEPLPVGVLMSLIAAWSMSRKKSTLSPA